MRAHVAGTSNSVTDYLSFQMCVLLTGLVRPSLAGKVTFFPSPPTCTSLVTGEVIVYWDVLMLKTSTINTQITSNYLQLFGHSLFSHVLLCWGLSELQQAGLCLVFKALATTSSPPRVGSIFPSQGKLQKYQKMVTVLLFFQPPHY